MLLNAVRMTDYQYDLPDDRIASHPLPQRDQSKLLAYRGGQMSDHIFSELPALLNPDDHLIFNNTRVVGARLIFTKATGGHVEVFLLEPVNVPVAVAMTAISTSVWRCTVGNARRWSDQLTLDMMVGDDHLTAKWVDREEGLVRLSWTGELTLAAILEIAGQVPLPPYIKRKAEQVDKERYQTVYSAVSGAVAAPTAGLHFTSEVLNSLKNNGIISSEVTLHVSAGTFLPVKVDVASEHTMHAEEVSVPRKTIENLLFEPRRVICVGTTSLRTIESLYWFGAQLAEDPDAPFLLESFAWSKVPPVSRDESLKCLLKRLDATGEKELTGKTSIYILPGYKFMITNGLITNFHQPGSTLLLLISALIGEKWKGVYRHAIDHGYRFLSYGDSSLLLP